MAVIDLDSYTARATDERTHLYITALVCIIFSVLITSYRLVVRYGRYGLDDLAMLLCFICVMTHSSLLIAASQIGLDMALTPETQADITTAAKLVFATRPLLSCALWASKLSSLLLLQRLLPETSIQTRLCTAGSVLVTLSCIAAILTNTTGCLATSTSTCSDFDIRIAVITALEIATESGIFGLAIGCFSVLQLERKQKYFLLVAFVARSCIIALSTVYLTTTILRPSNMTEAAHAASLLPLILSILLGTWALISAITPSLLPIPIPCIATTKETSSPAFTTTDPITLSSAPVSLFSTLKSFFQKPFSSGNATPREKKSRKDLRKRLSTPMSFFTDRLRGDRELYKYRTQIVSKGRKGEEMREGSLEGIFREETFEIEVC